MGKISELSKSKNWDRDFGMKVINEHEIIPVSKIRVNDTYQRAIEPGRLRKITKSIETSGYWPAEVIILNEKLEAVDGNHRVNAVKKLGIKTVPCSIVTFPSQKEEIRFFSHKNNWNTSLRPIDAWHAKYMSDHPIAKLIYSLESDPISLFFDFIAVKGKQTRKSRFTLGDALMIINTSAFNDYSQWQSRVDELMSTKTNEMPYDVIKDRTNKFLNIFYGIFGQNKSENHIPFRTESIKAFCRFYKSLNESGFIDTKSGELSAIKKMKSFVFDSGFIKADRTGKYMYFVTHYNKGRSASSGKRIRI